MALKRMVLDLSHWNTVTDWDAIVSEGNIYGVIHKATEGTGNIDKTYAQRAKDARSVGLLWGADHFLRPGDMKKQAEHFLKVVGDHGDTLLAIDHEDAAVSAQSLQDILELVADLSGRRPVIYSGHVLKEQVGAGHTELSAYRLWLAQYSKNPVWPPAWDRPWLWQYSETGKCPGVEGNVDEDCFDRSEVELAAEWAGDDDEPSRPARPTVKEDVVHVEITAPPGVSVVVTHKQEQR